MNASHPQAEVHGQPEFSAVITCLNEERSIREFHSRLTRTLDSVGREYEIIYVNDGSRDRTFEILCEIYKEHPRVRVVMDLFKNSGQGAAITAGTTETRGKHFIFMDSDLQIDPEDLPRLIEKYDEGYDYVTGYREGRRDSFFRILPSSIANVIMRRVSKSSIKDFGCNAKIFNAKLFHGYALGPSKVWHAAPMIAQIQRIAEIPVNHHAREYGKSGWTFKKLWQYNMENILRLSDKPFQIGFFLCMFFSFVFFMRIILSWFLPFHLIPTVTTGLILNVLIMALLVIVAILCGIGEFVIRIFVQSRQDPCYIIREIHRKRDDIPGNTVSTDTRKNQDECMNPQTVRGQESVR